MLRKSSMKLMVSSRMELVDDDVDSFFEKTVTAFGSGAKIDCPKEHLGKKVYVIVRKRK